MSIFDDVEGGTDAAPYQTGRGRDHPNAPWSRGAPAAAARGADATTARNLTAVVQSVTAEERAAGNGHCGGVLWLTGLSGSGKSTLAMALQRRLFARRRHVYVLDADNVRQGLNRDLGFAADDRSENIRRIAEMARLFADAGLVVVTAFISPFRRDRDRARAIIGDGFHEIYISAGLAECERRDTKGLYARARAGEIPEFTGISAPYEAPRAPQLSIDTETLAIDAALARLAAFADHAFVLPHHMNGAGGGPDA